MERKANSKDDLTLNTSVLDKPKCSHKFSVGAFVFTWLWGICNHLWWPIGMLFLILTASLSIAIALSGYEYEGLEVSATIIYTVLFLIYRILLGISGNKFAWERYMKGKEETDFHDIDKFERKQKNWNIAGYIGIALWILQIINLCTRPYLYNMF